MKLLHVVLGILMCSACSENESFPQINISKYKIAVLMQEGEQERWQQTANWALQNIADAQRNLNNRVELQLTFKNQDDDDIELYMQQLAEDEEVVAVIGPTTSDRAVELASVLPPKKAFHKPMITPSATSVEYQRRFAETPYVWNMAESDIAELEVILSGISGRLDSDSKSVLLLTPDDRDEQGGIRNAYAEWFGFIAEEYRLNVDGIYLYRTADDIRRCVREICGIDWRKSNKALVFNPSNERDALIFDEEVGTMKTELKEKQNLYTPQIFCSDAFVSDEIAAKVSHVTYEGVDLYALPESGFPQAYKQHFGRELQNGEAQFYDALCLVAYALARSQYSGQTLNDAILSVVDGRDCKGSSWLPADMTINFHYLWQGTCPDIDGVSSTWTFDERTHASVIGSTYRHWRLYEQQYQTIEYISVEGGNRSSSSKNMWEWTASNVQTFESEMTNEPLYGRLDERWALLVAASKGWSNYRFQADVFAMYKQLKQFGYEDDHIVLIAEDDIATHAYNVFPNALYITNGGTNVYEQEAIDYRLSELQPTDIGDILQGRSSDRLPYVLNSDANDNVLIFWSGHGSIGSVDFGGNHTISYSQIRNIIESVPHRKILFAVETCYGGGLGETCVGIPGILFITAANPYETSHAASWNEELGVYLSNGFTRGFQETISNNPNITIRDLYYSLARQTVGSHVMVYNAENYGNMYTNTMREFLESSSIK